MALRDRSTPSVLALSRQGLPMLRETGPSEEPVGARRLCAARAEGGARCHAACDRLGSRDRPQGSGAGCSIFTGSSAAVVSMPCWEKFETQDQGYRNEVLGTAPRIAVEAAARLGWDRWIGPEGAFIGMDGFGASARRPRISTSISASPPNGSSTRLSARTAGGRDVMSAVTILEDGHGSWLPAAIMSQPRRRISAAGHTAISLAIAAPGWSVIAGYDNPGGDVNPTLCCAIWSRRLST
jgi:hypothetical protein